MFRPSPLAADWECLSFAPPVFCGASVTEFLLLGGGGKTKFDDQLSIMGRRVSTESSDCDDCFEVEAELRCNVDMRERRSAILCVVRREPGGRR